MPFQVRAAHQLNPSEVTPEYVNHPAQNNNIADLSERFILIQLHG